MDRVDPGRRHVLLTLYSEEHRHAGTTPASGCPSTTALYETAVRLPDGPERNAALSQDDGARRRLCALAAPVDYPYDNVLAQRWVRGYLQHPFLRSQWRFYDVVAH